LGQAACAPWLCVVRLPLDRRGVSDRHWAAEPDRQVVLGLRCWLAHTARKSHNKYRIRKTYNINACEQRDSCFVYSCCIIFVYDSYSECSKPARAQIYEIHVFVHVFGDFESHEKHEILLMALSNGGCTTNSQIIPSNLVGPRSASPRNCVCSNNSGLPQTPVCVRRVVGTSVGDQWNSRWACVSPTSPATS
jgi:hypothetical protein